MSHCADLAAEISKQTGKDIPYKNLPQDEYAAVLKGVGIPADFAGALAAFDIDASNGALFDDKGQLSALIGRPTTRLASTLRKNATREVDQKELAGLLADLDAKAHSAGAGEA
ncbi:MAG: hypothetical protein KAY46_13320 [Burkholderiaceae bacterium]|nr:hypothetical protein [Burkholderiaceae bacterium]